MSRLYYALMIAASLVASCGYGLAGRRSTASAASRVMITSVRSAGAEPEVPALVEAEVRRAILNSVALELVDAEPDLSLDIRVLPVQLGLEPFSEPGLRAAQYRATVRLQVVGRGAENWRPVAFVGAERFFSPPGRIERLDGDGRRALGVAAGLASQRLVRALELHVTATSTAARPQPNRTQ